MDANKSTNGTEMLPDPLRWAVGLLSEHKHFIFLQSRLFLSAVLIIYVGAHGALRRPPSAAPGRHKTTGKRKKERDQFSEGLQASDAIMFPLIAGAILIGLYYLIQWLKDPAILNKILRAYMSVASIVTTGMLFGDGLHLLTGLVFPSVWMDSHGWIFRVDQSKQCQWRLGGPNEETSRTLDGEKKTPLPALLFAGLVSEARAKSLWTVRRLLKEEWRVVLAVHGLGKEKFGITLNGMIGCILALAVSIMYSLTGISWLNNIMGLGLCYGSFMVMSCTSFFVGSLVLVGLFIYDIIMVFYTPYMVTVATKIDAPIKLVFEGPSGLSTMLGLGDIVIPGMFLCLCLRFDLWKYYQRQITHVPTDLKTEVKDSETDSTITTTSTSMRAVKAEFVDPQGRWGDRFWTFSSRPVLSAAASTPGLAASRFPKPYFYTALAGYASGILFTLAMLLIFKRGQPALFYLVPGVLLPTWMRGVLAGELHDMWTYTEDGSLDTVDVVVEVDGSGQVIEKSSDDAKQSTAVAGAAQGNITGEASKTEVVPSKLGSSAGHDSSKSEADHAVFLLAITAPRDADVDEDED